jgi:regulator of RNase E activity RraA
MGDANSDPASTLGSTPTSMLSDAMAALGLRNRMTGALRLLAGGERLAGRAVTLEMAPADGRRPFTKGPVIHTEIIANCEEGSVIVFAGGGADVAFWGGQLSDRSRKRNLAGAVVDGGVRDMSELREAGFPVMGRGTSPISFIHHYEVAAVDIAVTVAGMLVEAGDLVVGDEDGLVAVPQGHFAAVSMKVQEIDELEQWIWQARQEGMSSLLIYDKVGEVLSPASPAIPT